MNWLNQNKYESEPGKTTTPTTPQQHTTTPTPAATTAPAPAPAASRPVEPAVSSSKSANIGKSILVKGEITGSEDLAIEGKVEGKITLTGCRVSIGSTAQVSAEIVAKTVIVGGLVKGSVRAEERIEVASTGNVNGDLRAPRVVLADGAKFKGSIDMDPNGGSSHASSSKSSSSSRERDRDPLLVPEESVV
jgi:cytoskeletal protein CcmA (bactofilin family)